MEVLDVLVSYVILPLIRPFLEPLLDFVVPSLNSKMQAFDVSFPASSPLDQLFKP